MLLLILVETTLYRLVTGLDPTHFLGQKSLELLIEIGLFFSGKRIVEIF